MLSEKLRAKLLEFRSSREWEQFHDARNLSAALAIEASELQEIFLWAKDAELAQRTLDRRESIEHEIADIAILLTYLCHDLGIDLEKSIADKIALNDRKYPVEKSRGTSKKYDRL